MAVADLMTVASLMTVTGLILVVGLMEVSCWFESSCWLSDSCFWCFYCTSLLIVICDMLSLANSLFCVQKSNSLHICENKGADQLRGYHKADQRL